MSLKDRLAAVNQRIIEALQQNGREPGTTTLIAVSKTQPAQAIREVYQAGVRHVGENYLQEALEKQQQLQDLDQLIWHFIGPLQSNKTRPIAESFDWVHTVDRLKIAERLSQQRPTERGPLNICLQVNVSGETSKSGLAPAELLPLAEQCLQLPNLRLRGLMAIPAPADDLEQQRQPLRQLQQLFTQLRQALPDAPLDTLSMGMSSDLEAAIAEGATFVRIGTDIFGRRAPKA